MQQGAFMILYSLGRDKYIRIINKNRGVIKIHLSLRDEAHNYLGRLGDGSYRLMPDSESTCFVIENDIMQCL